MTLDTFFVNHLPTAKTETAFTDGTDPLVILLAGSDPDGDSLMFSIVPGSGPVNGTLGPVEPVTETAANVTYTATTSDDLADSFVIQVDDSHGGVATAVIFINPSDTPREPSPVETVAAQDDAVEVIEGTSTTITLFGNAPSGVELDFSIVAGSGPTQGSVGTIVRGSLTSATVLYTPDSGATGSDSFMFEVCASIDGNLDCDTGTVTINLFPESEPEPPEVQDLFTNTTRDTPIEISLNAFLGNNLEEPGDRPDAAHVAATALRQEASESITIIATEAGGVADCEPQIDGE